MTSDTSEGDRDGTVPTGSDPVGPAEPAPPDPPGLAGTGHVGAAPGDPVHADPAMVDPATAQRAPLLEGRLHPSVIALWTAQSFAPVAALWIASSAERVIVLGGIVLTLVGAWVRWARFRWRVEAGQLVIEHGLLQRTRRVIPIERIQAVQAVRKIRHRVFGVVGLRIETVGGKETEGQLDALRPRTAAAVQRALLRSPTAAQAPSAEPAGAVLVRSTPGMLLVAGLTGGRVGVAAALLAFGQEVLGDRLADVALSAPERYGVTAVVVAVALGAVAAFVLSVVATLLTYWGFTVTRQDDLLRLRRGLLSERRDTVPVTRVQSLTIEENLVRRIFGLAAVRMVVAGRAGEDAAVTSTLLPIATRREAVALAGRLLGADDLTARELRAMPPGARGRRLVRAALAVLAVTALTWVVVDGPVGLLGLLSAGLAVPAALIAYGSLGWGATDRVVLARSGWLVRRTTVTPAHAPQSVRVSTSPFQRRRGLATVRLEIARARGTDPRLIDLDHGDAERLQRWLAERARAPRAAASTGLHTTPAAP